MSTPIAEERSRARTPRKPKITAAISDPATEPATRFTPSSSANDAPAKDSSLMPCTANVRSRIITKTPMTPPIRPSSAPAMIELWTRATRAP